MVTGPVAFFVSGVVDLTLLAMYLRRAAAARRAETTGALTVLVAVLALAGIGTLLGPGTGIASADTTEPSILMDDYAFIYSSPADVEKNLEQVAQLGVKTIKVSVVWSLVAPDPESRTEPDFNATDPSSYPAGAWSRYDTVVEDAAKLGLTVYFQLTAPAPLWAVNPDDVSGHQHPWSHEPNASDFQQFVRAVGARYSGTYQVLASTATPPGATQTTGTPTTTTPTSTTPDSQAGAVLTTLGTLSDPAGVGFDDTSSEQTLPAVRMWGIWNEPNIIGWLSPQTVTVAGHNEMRSPQMARALTNAGWTALVETGHADDTILIGETASGGAITPVPFVDALYCLNRLDRPLRGTAATRIGCPASGDTRQFVIANPGLFGASGWAHHPYSFNTPPNRTLAGKPTTISTANLGILERTLDRADAAYGQPGGMPIYITEWGYKSNPPDPYVHTSLSQQETWLDQGWYMSYGMRRVKAMAQELLYDQPPIAGKKPGSAAYWSNFDSGLEFENGRPKPSLAAFRLPMWLPSAHPGRHVRVWAEIRPAQVEGNGAAQLEFRPHGSSNWRTLTHLSTSSPEGFVVAHVSIPGAGQVRLAWSDPVLKQLFYSRTVAIS